MTAPERLTAGLTELLRARSGPACTTPGTSPLWTSEDATERATAAAGCDGCPLAPECLAAATELGVTFGVWAGHDMGVASVRRSLRGTERKVSA